MVNALSSERWKWPPLLLWHRKSCIPLLYSVTLSTIAVWLTNCLVILPKVMLCCLPTTPEFPCPWSLEWVNANAVSAHKRTLPSKKADVSVLSVSRSFKYPSYWFGFFPESPILQEVYHGSLAVHGFDHACCLSGVTLCLLWPWKCWLSLLSTSLSSLALTLQHLPIGALFVLPESTPFLHIPVLLTMFLLPFLLA